MNIIKNGDRSEGQFRRLTRMANDITPLLNFSTDKVIINASYDMGENIKFYKDEKMMLSIGASLGVDPK